MPQRRKQTEQLQHPFRCHTSSDRRSVASARHPWLRVFPAATRFLLRVIVGGPYHECSCVRPSGSNRHKYILDLAFKLREIVRGTGIYGTCPTSCLGIVCRAASATRLLGWKCRVHCTAVDVQQCDSWRHHEFRWKSEFLDQAPRQRDSQLASVAKTGFVCCSGAGTSDGDALKRTKR